MSAGISGRDATSGKEFAYYFSDRIWRHESIYFMKSMLLFFDGIALALPSNLAEQVINDDPILAAPLAERGLLINFGPAGSHGLSPAGRPRTGGCRARPGSSGVRQAEPHGQQARSNGGELTGVPPASAESGDS